MTASSTPRRRAVPSAPPRTTIASTAPRANCSPIASCTNVKAATTTLYAVHHANATARERANANATVNTASAAAPNRSGRAEYAANVIPNGSNGISIATISLRSDRRRPNNTTAVTKPGRTDRSPSTASAVRA